MRSSIRLITSLDGRHMTAHRLRLILSIFGVASGVALAVAVSALGSSIDASLQGIASATASKANVEVRPISSVGLPDSTANAVRRVKGVRVAGSAVESYATFRSGPRKVRALLLGMDSELFKLAPEVVTQSAFKVVDQYGLFLPKGVADELDVSAGDSIEVSTPLGWQRRNVGAIVTGDGRGGRIVVGALGIVQNLVGRNGRVDVVYAQASDPDDARRNIAAELGPSTRVGPIALRGRDVAEMLATTTSGLNIAAIVALFVGAFLVYNTMSMAAVERLTEAAVLRALGARRRQILGLFVAEGALLGIIGALAGLFAGVFMARFLLSTRGAALEQVFPIDIRQVVLNPTYMVLAGLGGIAASTLAAWLPARRVAWSEPSVALGPSGALEDPTAQPRRNTAIIGTTAFVAGSALSAFDLLVSKSRSTTIATIGMVIALTGAALLVRVLVPLVAQATLGRVSRNESSSGIGRLAAGEVLRSPGRTAFTAGAILLALSLVVGFSIAMGSFTRTFETGIKQLLRADLYVRSATWRPFGSDVPIDANLAGRIRAIDGVATVYPFRLITGNYRERNIVVTAFDYDAYSKLADLEAPWRSQINALSKALAPNDTIAITPSVTSSFGIKVGDRINFPTPSGVRRMRVVGEFPDPSAVTPTFTMPFSRFVSLYQSIGADSFGVGLKPGANLEQVRTQINDRYEANFGVVVDTRREFEVRVNSFVRSILGLISSVQLVAVLVAALGLANTLLISTLERRRDLGVLRSIGMLRSQMRRMVTVEALLVAALGVALSWVLGTLVGLFMFKVMQAQAGVPIRLWIGFKPYLWSGLLGLVVAGAAAFYPARRAARTDIVDALQYE